MKPSQYFYFPLFALLATSTASFAQTSVESKLERLEETVRVLERRIALLEEQSSHRSAVAPVAPEKVSWRKLQTGMPEKEVERLLGSPKKVDVIAGSATWYYGDSGGRVRFMNGQVIAWSEP